MPLHIKEIDVAYFYLQLFQPNLYITSGRETATSAPWTAQTYRLYNTYRFSNIRKGNNRNNTYNRISPTMSCLNNVLSSQIDKPGHLHIVTNPTIVMNHVIK